MKLKQKILTAVLMNTLVLSGCNLTDEEKEKLNEAQVDLEQLADQIIITYPANQSTISDSVVTVRADIPSSAEAQKVTLFVDGIEVANDSDGAPWEIEWPSYYWADGSSHTLLLKTVTGGGNEVRNNQQFQVVVDADANSALSFLPGLNGTTLKDENTVTVEFSPFEGATRYELKHLNQSTSKIIEVETLNVELTDLTVGFNELSYRAIREISSSATLVGPWSNSAIVEVLPPDLPSLNTPQVSKLETDYELQLSWSDFGDGSTYAVELANVSNNNEPTLYEDISGSSLTISNVEIGKYEWTLTRTNSLGQSSLTSSSVAFDVGVFHKRFGGSSDDRGKFITSTKSGKYLVLASTKSQGDPSGDDWIFMLSEQGEMEWEYLYTAPGAPKFRELFELSNGNIIGFGSTGEYPNYKGLIVMIDSSGSKLWEKEYSSPDVDRLGVKGVSELNGDAYMLSEGIVCTTVRCKVQAPRIDSIDLDNGAILQSIQVEGLDNAEWDAVGSFKTTSSGSFLLGFSVLVPGCNDFGCSGAGMATVNLQGEIETQWNSLSSFTFLNGRNAVESPVGGFVLSGQSDMGDGVPVSLFDETGTFIGTYTYPGAYSNLKEYIAFNSDGLMYQLVENSSVDWPILISRDLNGFSQEEKIFTELKRESASPAALDSVSDGGLVLLFSEYQSDYSNADVVVIKTGKMSE